MKQQISDIVRIKKIREDSALNEMKRKEALLEKAIKNLEQKEKELVEYKQWRIQEENRLYNTILKKRVYLKDIESLKLEIIHNKLKEEDYVQARDKAQNEKDVAYENFLEAKKEYAQSVINTEKTSEILKIVTEEETAEADKAEESEIEEQTTSVSIGPREEWEE